MAESMIPVIAIVGRPNVGKSTLFNRLTRTRSALVADRPGITRDRQYGFAEHAGRRFVVVDTGGLGEVPEGADILATGIEEQSLRAVAEADAIIWLVDGRAGLTTGDERLADALRRSGKPLHVVVNKTENLDPALACAEFHALGLGATAAISATHGHGIADMLDEILEGLPGSAGEAVEDTSGLPIAVIGRPNVGKSTLVNRMLGEDRMLTSDLPGTTRDSIAVPFTRRGRHYVLIDTAGIRRRGRVTDPVEKASVARSMQAMDRARVVIAVLDGSEGVTEQDVSLLGLAAQSGKSLIIAINKWDGLEPAQRERVHGQVERRLAFVDYACVQYISALHGTGVGKLFDLLDAIGASQQTVVRPAALTRILEDAVEQHAPPLVRGRRIKLRYAHIGGHDPLRIIIHGNQTEKAPESYRRYLSTRFRERLELVGTPVVVEFKRGENPYKGKKTARKAGRKKAKRKVRTNRRR